ncbi:MAG: hypothetical protein LBS95_01790 [Mycoplasmataceae bacterium]|nr:hypothetical protein [Mycoplasmataceae bacterium]
MKIIKCALKPSLEGVDFEANIKPIVFKKTPIKTKSLKLKIDKQPTLRELVLNLIIEVKEIKKTLNEHTTILNEHTATLNKHTIILKKHSAILKQHSATLKAHSIMLKEHSNILRRHSDIFRRNNLK